MNMDGGWVGMRDCEMDLNEITTLISSFGFPICACSAMGYYINKINNEHRDEVKELNREHSEEMNNLKDAINNNTLALEKLITVINSKEV